MREHILLATAVRSPHKSTPDVPGAAHYDPVRGYWLYRGAPWAESQDVMPFTKKNDSETGEDQKGE